MNNVVKSPLSFGIQIAFRSTAFVSCLLVIHAVLIGVLPSLIVVLEANFLDETLALLASGFDFAKLIIPTSLLVAAIAIMWIAKSLKSVMRTLMISSIREYLLPQIYDKKAALAYEDYENAEICNLIQRISTEPELTVTNAFLHLLIFISDIIVVVALFCLIATYAWKTAIIAFLVSLPLFLLAIKSGKANYEAAQKTTQLERKSEYFDKILLDKHAVYERSLFQYGGVFIERCFEINEVIRKILIKTRLIWFIKMKSGSIFIAIISLSMTLLLLDSLSKGAITIGLFTALVSAVFKLVNKLSWEMTDVVDSLAKKSEYLRDLRKFFQMNSLYNPIHKIEKEAIVFESLEFKKVSFTYPNSFEPVLKDLSFRLLAGKHYAIIGVNGAGKTTIIKLMLGLYLGYSGDILINGKDLKEYDPNELHRFYSVVFQDFSKYQISVKDNILLPIASELGSEKAENKLQEVIQTLQLNNILDKLRHGAETELGKLTHEGMELSHGQWQRIAIARALVADAPLCILDEPCSALDAINEQQLYREYDHLLKDKTMISITHRLGATQIANDIIVISNGTKAAEGSHEELYNTLDLYREMYDKQKGWYENAC